MDNNELRAEIEPIQDELHVALSEILREIGGKLKPHERAEIELEFGEMNEVLERLKSGLVWIAVFGRTNAGKSATVNALLEADVAQVGVEHDVTRVSTPYEKAPWKIVDVPGVLGDKLLEEQAVAEAKKAHGLLFVVEGEPFAPELALFDFVHSAVPNAPTIVFVNKWDVVQNSMPRVQQEIVKQRVQEKMGHLVKSPSDIVFGSAELYDAALESMIRQKLPQLLDRMHEDVGTLGLVMNTYDPARRAEELCERMREKIVEARIRVARKLVLGFGVASAGGTVVPLSHLLVVPGILASMVFSIAVVMGAKLNREQATRLTIDLVRAAGAELAIDVAATFALDALTVLTAWWAPPLAVVTIGGASYLKYRRTVILGEVAIEYLRLGCSWGGERPEVVIRRCKERANDHYLRRWGKAA